MTTGSSSGLSSTPNVTPLIDVLLVLLIIFMVITPTTPHGLDALVPQRSHHRGAGPFVSGRETRVQDQ
jgi:biopolymer transport protein ExbD